MFRPEANAPIADFEGYAVRCFRQGGANLAERTLRAPTLHFVPWRGVLGVFLPRGADFPGEAALRAAWEARGAPPPHRPGAHERVLLGRVLPIRNDAYAGCNDVWEEAGTLVCAWRRAPDPVKLEARLDAYAAARLLETAQDFAGRFAPRLPRQPAALVVRRMGRCTLGQCRRDGEIRLSPALAQFPPETIEETLAHELAHLTHFNHAPDFWRTLTALLPDWLPRALIHYCRT